MEDEKKLYPPNFIDALKYHVAKNSDLRQIEIDCDCGNHLSATVLSFDSFDLTCNKCRRNFVEGIDQVWGIKDHIVTQWIQQ